MTRLALERWLPMSPETAWGLVTDPAQMSRWSLAPVRWLARGDGDGPDAVGALREVSVGWRGVRARLVEVIELAERPAKLVYRVVRGAPLRHHRGEIRLAPDGDGTRLEWDVEYRFAVPGMAWAATVLLRTQLEESLTRLAAMVDLAAEPIARATVRREELDERNALTALYAAADAILDEQRRVAGELKAARDPKWGFARAYQLVTEQQLAACRAGRFTHPAWVLRLVPRFHYYYFDNLAAWRAGEHPLVEPHWRSAFAVMERGSPGTPLGLPSFFHGLAKGVQAHIEEDLPRALADVYRRHYARRCAYGRFRADYALMSDIFGVAGARLREELLGRSARLCDRLLPDEVAGLLTARWFYDVLRQRWKAFDRGERIAQLLVDDAGRSAARRVG